MTDVLHKKERGNLGQNRDFVTIECKDLDEITTKAKLFEALQFKLGLQSNNGANIKWMRKVYGDTQIVTINLPFEVAKKAISVVRVRIRSEKLHQAT